MAITYENGHYRSYRPVNETVEVLKKELAQMTPRQRAAVEEIIKQYGVKGQTSVADIAERHEWDKSTGPPIPVRQWVNDKYYLGETADTLFPRLKEDMVELFEGNYYECILTGSIGWGKDYFATTALVRVIYELICLKSPTDTLGLGKGETIHIVPISHLKEAAQRVVFQGVSKKLHLSPFFKGRFEETKEEIRFPGKNVVIVGGGSNDNSALGLNVWSALVDEMNFMGKGRRGSTSAGGQNARHDKGQGLYDTIQRRVKSRYAGQGLRGMVFLVSSKRSLADFTERRIAEVIKDNDPGVFVRDYATWDVRTGAFKGQKWWSAATSPREGRTRILGERGKTTDEVKRDEILFSFPDQYYREFLNDPEGATRDIAGIAMESFKPFFSNRQAIEDMQKPSRPHPFHIYDWPTSREIQVLWKNLMMDNVHGDPVPRCCPNAPRHCHADMSKNQDATGFCVGHHAGEVPVMRRDPETGEMKKEEAPVIHIDLVLRVVPPYAGEVDHQAVRSLIYKLREGGLPIRSVSMDRWMGLPNLQLIQKHGFKIEEISTQKTLDPYLSARSALYERRVESPVYATLAKEIRELELNEEGTKVDHPKTGSKDLADAWAAVIYYLSRNHQPTGAYGVSRGMSDIATNDLSGPRPTSSGGFRWPDEPDPDIERESDGLPSWIIS